MKNTMKKKVTRQDLKGKTGGKRPGSGRPATGRNTKNIGYSVHKDFAPIIDKMVKAKLKELRETQKST
jgi:hypothetical protein